MILPTSSWVVKSKIGLVYILGKPIFAQFFRACLLSQTHLKYFIYQYGWIDQNMDKPRPIFRTSTFLSFGLELLSFNHNLIAFQSKRYPWHRSQRMFVHGNLSRVPQRVHFAVVGATLFTSFIYSSFTTF